jgi:hypothetical protein
MKLNGGKKCERESHQRDEQGKLPSINAGSSKTPETVMENGFKSMRGGMIGAASIMVGKDHGDQKKPATYNFRFVQGTYPGKQPPADEEVSGLIFYDVPLEGDKTKMTTLSDLAAKCRSENRETDKRVFKFPKSVQNALKDKTMQLLLTLGSVEDPSYKGLYESMKEKKVQELINLLGPAKSNEGTVKITIDVVEVEIWETSFDFVGQCGSSVKLALREQTITCNTSCFID